ncbi:hypothetical protein NDU88_003159, partial [Pleurodeles waltl]
MQNTSPEACDHRTADVAVCDPHGRRSICAGGSGPACRHRKECCVALCAVSRRAWNWAGVGPATGCGIAVSPGSGGIAGREPSPATPCRVVGLFGPVGGGDGLLWCHAVLTPDGEAPEDRTRGPHPETA